MQENEGSKFPFRQIWKGNAPPKVVFFAWEANKGCILTIDKLFRRGMIMVNGCYLCKGVAETLVDMFSYDA